MFFDLTDANTELVGRCYLAQEDDVAKLLERGEYPQEVLDEALVISSRKRHGAPIMKLLLEHGANIEYVGFAGKTALEFAEADCISRNVEFLKVQGARWEVSRRGRRTMSNEVFY